MAIRRPKYTPFDIAERLGIDRFAESEKARFEKEQLETGQKLEAYQEDVDLVDVVSSIFTDMTVSSIAGFLGRQALKTVGAAGTGGLLPIAQMFLSGKELADKGTKLIPKPGSKASTLMKLLGSGTKAGARLLLQPGVRKGAMHMSKVRKPEAPSYDLSRLRGPGHGEVRNTIADALALSKVGFEGDISATEKERELTKLLYSIGPFLKEETIYDKSKIDGENVVDWFSNFGGMDLAPLISTPVKSIASKFLKQ